MRSVRGSTESEERARVNDALAEVRRKREQHHQAQRDKENQPVVVMGSDMSKNKKPERAKGEAPLRRLKKLSEISVNARGNGESRSEKSSPWRALLEGRRGGANNLTQ